MRYSTRVYFISKPNPEYDPDTGEWSSPETKESMRWANVTDMGAERKQKIFGDVSEKRKVIRMQRPYSGEYDSIRIDGADGTYHSDTEHLPSERHSLVVIKDA